MRGFTLLEILLAVVVSSVMMLGVFSVNFAILSLNKTSTAKSGHYLRTQALAKMITADAVNAVGTVNDVGVCMNNVESKFNYFCFRNAGSLTNYPFPSASTAPAGAMPTWNCYTRLDDNGNNVGIYVHRCTTAVNNDQSFTGNNPLNCANTNIPDQNFGRCSKTDPMVGVVVPGVFTGMNVYPSFGNNAAPVTNTVFSMRVIGREDALTSVITPAFTFLIDVTPPGHSL